MFALLAACSTLINFLLLLERNATLERLRQSSSSINSLSSQLAKQDRLDLVNYTILFCVLC